MFAIDHRAVGEFARAQTLLRLGRALLDVWCGSFRQMPRRIKLDIDDTFDAVHGDQQLRACSTSITTTMASSRS